jgi:hypothetical protein
MVASDQLYENLVQRRLFDLERPHAGSRDENPQQILGIAPRGIPEPPAVS